jgi:DnaJ-like protein
MAQPSSTLLAALDILGLGVEADRGQITAAYRRLAKATHPDLCSDPEAAARFGVVAAAYHRAVSAQGARQAATSPTVRPTIPGDPVAAQASTVLRWPRVVVAVGPVHVQPFPASDFHSRPHVASAPREQ